MPSRSAEGDCASAACSGLGTRSKQRTLNTSKGNALSTGAVGVLGQGLASDVTVAALILSTLRPGVSLNFVTRRTGSLACLVRAVRVEIQTVTSRQAPTLEPIGRLFSGKQDEERCLVDSISSRYEQVLLIVECARTFVVKRGLFEIRFPFGTLRKTSDFGQKWKP